MTHITAQLLRSVEEEYEVIYRSISGDFIECAKYIKIELDFPDRTKANKLLRNSGEHFHSGDYYSCMELIARFSLQGIHCDLIQIKESPWNKYSDVEIEKIMFWSEWTALSPHLKDQWLDTIRLLYCKYNRTRYDSPGVVYYLDGRKTTDLTSFLIAIGETVNGAGGYFGGCLYGLSDCLSGDFRIADTYTIEWSHSDFAKEKLNSSGVGCDLYDEICLILGNALKCL